MTDLMNGKEKYNVAWFNNYIEGLEDPAIPPLPKFEEIVMSVLKTQFEKREHIIADVTREINSLAEEYGTFGDDSIDLAVTHALQKLEKQGKVIHGEHGYWAKK